jgi:hypothetical protein
MKINHLATLFDTVAANSGPKDDGYVRELWISSKLFCPKNHPNSFL